MPRLIDADALLEKKREMDLCFAVREVDIEEAPTIEAEPVRHGRCPICNGEKPMLQDCNNGVSIEVDAYQMEMTVWMGDECLAVFSIDYCPNCGAKMDGDDHAV